MHLSFFLFSGYTLFVCHVGPLFLLCFVEPSSWSRCSVGKKLLSTSSTKASRSKWSDWTWPACTASRGHLRVPGEILAWLRALRPVHMFLAAFLPAAATALQLRLRWWTPWWWYGFRARTGTTTAASRLDWGSATPSPCVGPSSALSYRTAEATTLPRRRARGVVWMLQEVETTMVRVWGAKSSRRLSGATEIDAGVEVHAR